MSVLSNIDFRFYFWLFRRRFALLMMVVLAASALGIALILLWPPTYQATAKILVESPQIPTELAKSTVPTGAAEQFQIIQEDVLSRANVLALADHFGIYRDRADLSQTDKFEDMIRRLSISPVPIDAPGGGVAATVYYISFKADRPDTAANLVNDLVTMILDKDVKIRTQRATGTVGFFTHETQRLDEALRQLDGKILQFKNEHIAALPDSIDFRRNQQTTQQQRLLVLAQEEASLRKRQGDLQSRPLDATATPTTPEEQSLQALRQSLTQQQALFSEDSPTITALRDRIATLERAILGHSSGSTAPRTPRDFEIADIAERISGIGDERKSIEQSITALDASIEETPGNETALNSMQRDHQNLQAQYDAAIARLAEASTGQQIEFLLKGERLSLIEQALPPQAPLGPKQKVLMLASLAGALLLGLLAIIAPELLNRKIRRPAELINRLQIAPFVTVPYVERNIFRPARLAVWIGVLIAIPTLLLAVGAYFPPIKDAVGQARANFTSAISTPGGQS